MEALRQALLQEEERQLQMKETMQRESVLRIQTLEKLKQKREKELAAVKIQGMVHRKYMVTQHRQFMTEMEERVKTDSRILLLEEESEQWNNDANIKRNQTNNEQYEHNEHNEHNGNMNGVQNGVQNGFYSTHGGGVDGSLLLSESNDNGVDEEELDKNKIVIDSLLESSLVDDAVEDENGGKTEMIMDVVIDTAVYVEDTIGIVHQVNMKTIPKQEKKEQKEKKKTKNKKNINKTTKSTLSKSPVKSRNSNKSPPSNKSKSNSKIYTKDHTPKSTIPEWALHESAQVIQLRNDLRVEQSEREMLSEEIKVLRDYVMYRVEKSKNKNNISKINDSNSNINNKDIRLSWQQHKNKNQRNNNNNNNESGDERDAKLPRLWQMPWNERYQLMSNSYNNAGRPPHIQFSTHAKESINKSKSVKTFFMNRKFQNINRPSSAQYSKRSNSCSSNGTVHSIPRNKHHGKTRKKIKKRRDKSAMVSNSVERMMEITINKDKYEEQQDFEKDFDNPGDVDLDEQERDLRNTSNGMTYDLLEGSSIEGPHDPNKEEWDDYEKRKKRRAASKEYNRRQIVIQKNYGPTATTNQKIQAKRRRVRSESAGRDRNRKTMKELEEDVPEQQNSHRSGQRRTLDHRQNKTRPRSAVVQRKGKNSRNGLKFQKKKKKKKKNKNHFVNRTVDTLSNVDRGREGGDIYLYTGNDDIKSLRSRFQQEVAYSTMPWTPQSSTSTNKNRKKNENFLLHQTRQQNPNRIITGSPILDRSSNSPQQLAPLFDQWLISPGGEKYKRQGSIKANDFIEQVGKAGLLGSHRKDTIDSKIQAAHQAKKNLM